MSANLDKSLDEIIATKPRGPRNARSRRTSGGRGSVSKTGTSTVKKAVAKKAPVAPAASKINIIDEASKLADRIIISNLVCTKLIRTWIRPFFVFFLSIFCLNFF